MLCFTMLMCLLLAAMAFGQVEVTTSHNDSARTGANLRETILSTLNVNVSDFGKLFTRTVDGQIYAQPLYLSQVDMAGKGRRNVVYVATEHNSVYAFDADLVSESAPLWHVNLGPAVPSEDICQSLAGSSSCQYTDLVPEIGITSTPVIDSTTGTLYVVAKTKTGSDYQFNLHALDVSSGAEKFGGPVTISASVEGSGSGSQNGTLSFDALHHLNRPALLLLKGVVYVAFGAIGDVPPFHGWVMGYDAGTLQQISVFNASPDGDGAGIWASGQGLAADGDSIFLATGNGTFDGNSSGRDWGSSFLRLQPAHGLAVADYFTPQNQGYLTSADLDVGASGPVLLPGMNLLLGIGKDGVLRLLNTTQFGKFNAAFNNDVQEFQPTGFFLGTPLFWNGPQGPVVYLWGTSDFLKQYGFSGGQLQVNPLSQSTISASQGTWNSVSLSLSANSSVPGSGIIWATTADSGDGGASASPGVLRAFDAQDLSHELWDSKQNAERDQLGDFAKFSPPTIANGKVYAPTFSGQLVVYGLTSGDFTLRTEETVTLSAGQSESTTVQIIPQADGLSSPVSLSCSGLPAGVNCTFSPQSLPVGSGPVQATLVLSSSSAAAGKWPQYFPATFLWVAGICLSAAPLAGERKLRPAGLLLLGLLAASLLLTFGCGGGSSPAPLTVGSAQPMNSRFSVVATSGGIEHRGTIKLVVH
jgi:hypothetical protein